MPFHKKSSERRSSQKKPITSLGDLVKLAATQKQSKTTFVDIVKSATTTAAAHFITDFSGIDSLQNAERLSIELADWRAVQKAISRYALRNQCDFNPVPFVVRDMDKGHATVFTAEIASDQGFILTNPSLPEDQKEVMIVSWPGQTGNDLVETTIGTLSHPAGVVLYKVNRVANTDEANVYNVHKATGKDAGCVFSAVEKPTCTLLTARCFGITFDGSKFEVKEGPKPVAEVVPKLTGLSNVYMIAFLPGVVVDIQTKAAVLGMALLFTMQIAYPELSNIHEESRSRKKIGAIGAKYGT